jgi:NTP pyrophosphatase (non-canonical NTP hydrolase)
MAHTCPVCGMTCHCNGDIDDICLDLEDVLYQVDILACTHCPDDEDDFEEEFWEDK